MSRKIEDISFDRDSKNHVIKNNHNIEKMRDLLNETGPGFCLAKWTQVTLHLGSGLTHSCHHPVPHKIPLDEIKDNPAALHNTKFKKVQRKAMLNGERPAECDYCWRIEDKFNGLSDRFDKSVSNFSIENHDKIVEMTGDEDVYPTYLEVSFNRTCNFKCAYCGPDFSSKWAEEISSEGYYEMPVGEGYNWSDNVHILQREENPYIDAFWKWWPDLKEHLMVLRITGGEPMLNKNTFKMLDQLIDDPAPNLEFSVNTNGCVPEKIWDNFIEKINYLVENKCIKKFTLYTSAESYGNQNDYVRYGMDFSLWQRNIEKFLKETNKTRVTIMAAFNILSITSFKEFLEYVHALKMMFNYNGYFPWLEENNIDVVNGAIRSVLPEKYQNKDIETFWLRKIRNNEEIFCRVGIDIPYVRNPKFLDANIIDLNLLNNYLIPALSFMSSKLQDKTFFDALGFEDWEVNKLKKIVTSLVSDLSYNLNDDQTAKNIDIGKERARFVSFVNEYDRRRGTNFLETFPEMKEFYELCLIEYNNYKEKE